MPTLQLTSYLFLICAILFSLLSLLKLMVFSHLFEIVIWWAMPTLQLTSYLFLICEILFLLLSLLKLMVFCALFEIVIWWAMPTLRQPVGWVKQSATQQ